MDERDELRAHEGADALRLVDARARKAQKRPTAAKSARAAGDVTESSPAPASEPALPTEAGEGAARDAAPMNDDDPLEGLFERFKARGRDALEPLVCDELFALQRSDPSRFAELRSGLQGLGLKIMDLESFLRSARFRAEERERLRAEEERKARAQEHARRTQQEAEEREKERAEAIARDPWRARHFGFVKLSNRLEITMEPGRIITKHVDAKGGATTQVAARFSGYVQREVSIHRTPGAKAERIFVIEVLLDGDAKPVMVDVAAADWLLGRWIEVQLGSRVRIAPYRSAREEVRSALTEFHRPERQDRYGFIGWIARDEGPVYLSAGASIDAGGVAEGIATQFETSVLERYRLPPPPEGDELRDVARHAILLFDVDPPEVAMPLFALVWRAVLGPVRTSILIIAPPGLGKTALAMLAQQHFGLRFDAPPAEWGLNQSSTNSLTVLATRIGDAVLLVDDLVLTGDRRDDREQLKKVDAVIRPQFNGTASLRATRERGIQDALPSRCSIIATAENTPHGQSLGDRFLKLTLPKRSRTDLNPHKARGTAGVYARAMAGFICWLAPQLAEIRAQADVWRDEARATFVARGHDDRIADALADLVVGIRLVKAFGRAVGALDAAAADDLERRALEAFDRVAAAQKSHKEEQDPALRFGPLLAAALAAGQVHVQLTSGRAKPPPNPTVWGWTPAGQSQIYARGGAHDSTYVTQDDYRAGGDCVGYFDPKEPDTVFLLIGPALSAVRAQAARQGNPFPIAAERELLRRLKDRDLLTDTALQSKRPTYLKRKWVAGVQRDLAWFNITALGIEIRPEPEPKPAKERGRAT